MSDNNKLDEIIRTSLDSIRSMIDSNTVIGDPITTQNGTLVIPVSKVFVGFASGGLDYRGKNTADSASNKFGGGGGPRRADRQSSRTFAGADRARERSFLKILCGRRNEVRSCGTGKEVIRCNNFHGMYPAQPEMITVSSTEGVMP